MSQAAPGDAGPAAEPPADVPPAEAACAELRVLLKQADEVLARGKTLSGRAAQLDATQRTLEQDLGFVKAEIERLQVAAKAAARSAGQQARREPAPPPLPNAPWLSPRLAGLSLRLLRRIRCLRSHPAASQGGELAGGLERALYNAHAVLVGSGPGGDLRGLMAPPSSGPFVELMLGAAARLQLSRPEARLRLKEEYYAFRDRTTPAHILAPLALLALRANPPHESALPREVPPALARLLLPLCLQAYFCWLLWFFVSLALREHALRVNGSSIRGWWIRHHYYSIALMLAVLTMPQSSRAFAAFTERYLWWSAAQGSVMLLQNSYQRKRTYTRIALGRASAMDVASGESGGTSGQLRLLFPLLFALQAAQAANGVAVLAVAWDSVSAAMRSRDDGPPLEWQALAAGVLPLVTALGSLAATFAALVDKRRAGRRERQLRLKARAE